VNGAGKSTFLKVLSSRTEPTQGRVTVGANVGIGYFSQHSMDLLDPGKTVFETLQDAIPIRASAPSGTCARHTCSRETTWARASRASREERRAGGPCHHHGQAPERPHPGRTHQPPGHPDPEIQLDALKRFNGTVIW
jgi:ATP-binding cassette subfamily F protein 3